MRPGMDVLGARPRKDLDPSYLPPLAHGLPTSFRIASEEELEASSTARFERGNDSTYGVQSLQSTIYEPPSLYKDKKAEDSLDDDADSQSGRRRSTLKSQPKLLTRDLSRGSVGHHSISTGDSSPHQPGQEGPSPPSMSHSLASLSLDSQAQLSSLPSSPKSTSNRSLRPSDEESMDDGGSQAIASSEDDDADPQSEIQGSAPQLIMPSIKMPNRRPFTEQGKSMGRLKVLIAGDSGVGKTSLIKSIVQTCEDIVHVDPLSPSSPTTGKLTGPKSTSAQDKPSVRTTQQITEVFASTKPYPTWWSDIQETKVLRRRKSMGDIVLERNLCFVDTPGYGNGISRMETMQSILQYIEIQLTKPFSAPTATEGDIAGLLSGSGGTQVDVIFYLIAQEIKDEDIHFLQRLTAITNVIPTIAKSDTLSLEETERLRRNIDKLQEADIRFFTFSSDTSATQSSFTICSAPSNDNDNMDASILMSPDYVQPLLPSELAALVQRLFQPDNIACLRHLAAKKLVHAQGSRVFSTPTKIQHSTSSPHTIRTESLNTSPSSLITFPSLVPFNHNISPYNKARIADHTQQEERLAQIRLAKWAGELQRSLQNERARYEAIARGDRAVWLTEKLGECVNDGTVAVTRGSKPVAPNEKDTLSAKPEISRASGHRGLLDAGDPLGLLRWNEAMRRRGWIAFQVVGGFGILGAMAVWMARSWGSESYTQWTWEWLGGRA